MFTLGQLLTSPTRRAGVDREERRRDRRLRHIVCKPPAAAAATAAPVGGHGGGDSVITGPAAASAARGGGSGTTPRSVSASGQRKSGLSRFIHCSRDDRDHRRRQSNLGRGRRGQSKYSSGRESHGSDGNHGRGGRVCVCSGVRSRAATGALWTVAQSITTRKVMMIR